MTRTQLHAAALALVVQVAGCHPRAAPAIVERVRAPEPPVAQSKATTVTPVESPGPLAEGDAAKRVQQAYLARAGGRADEARAMFAEVVRRLGQAHQHPVPGLGPVVGYAVRGKTAAGLTGNGGTLFFDPGTGEPFAFSAGVSLRPEGPVVDAPFFVTTPLGLHDPTTGTKLGRPLIAVHPDGHRAYVLDESCRLHEWNIAEARATRALGAHRAPLIAKKAVFENCAACSCDEDILTPTVIAADGRWLSWRWGRWNLTTGALVSFPIPWDGFAPALSLDGRYVAYILSKPSTPDNPLMERDFLALYDVERGASPVAPKLLYVLSNSTPLSFGTDPRRVCVFDYGSSAFAVPSLALLAKLDGRGPRDPLLDCTPLATPPPLPPPELLARLVPHVCSVGGLLLPREYCER